MNTYFNIECPEQLLHVAVTLLTRLMTNRYKNKAFDSVIHGRKWYYGHDEKLGYFVEYIGKETTP